ncbi:Kinesin motor domain [Trinorchestia longiramus]|nr:Kinesin motor domain [Trinorchestia longiramus]
MKSHSKQKPSSHGPVSGSFTVALKDYPPPLPPHLLRKLSCKDTTSVGKVKVLLKVSQGGEVPGSCRVLSVDNRRRCVTLYDPATPTAVLPPSSLTPTKIIQTGAIPQNGAISTKVLSSAAEISNDKVENNQVQSEIPDSVNNTNAVNCSEDERQDKSFSNEVNGITNDRKKDRAIASSIEEINVCKELNDIRTVENTSVSEKSRVVNESPVSKAPASVSDFIRAEPVHKKSDRLESSISIENIKDETGAGSVIVGKGVDICKSKSTSDVELKSVLKSNDSLSHSQTNEANLCSATIKGVSAPKMFTFDGIFTHDDSQTELCSAALTDTIAAALRGAQGAVFTFGQPHLGQRETMVGSSKTSHTLGVLPSAICWLYSAMQEGKIQENQAGEQKSWSVSVSAVQVGPGDQVVDLLQPFTVSTPTDHQQTAIWKDGEKSSNSSCAPNHQSSSSCTNDDELFPSLLNRVCDVPAPTLSHAAQLLDLVLSARHVDEFGRPAHLLFSLNIYQQEKGKPLAGSGAIGSAGCWGRLHLLDFGPVDRGSRSSGGRAVTLSALGNTILAIINGQKQPPQKQVQLGLLGRLVRECVGSLRCVTSMIVHVSAEPHKYQDTLASIQLAARVHRLRRRRVKPQIGGSGSGGSSEESRSGRSSRGTITDTGSSSMDPSSSELSCDTVIYVGPGADDATDSEHPPVFLPSSSSPENRCSIRKALRGSSIDAMRQQDSPRTPRKIIQKKSPKHGTNKESHSPLKQKDKCCENDPGGGKEYGNLESVEAVKYSPNTSSRSPCKHCSHLIKNGTVVSPKHLKCSHGGRQRKTPLTENIVTCGPGTSDEQWVDGPRFHKSKVLESQKIKEYELETWIDGPEATYGYMDDVKKVMIQKWVETQNSQSHVKDAQSKSPKHKPFKEMTQFKTSELDETSPKHRDKHRDKRRSSDGRELKKDSTKLSSHSKDSPHRRRSFNGPQQRTQNVSELDQVSVMNNVCEKNSLENSSPSKCRHFNPVPKEAPASSSSPKKELQNTQHIVTSNPVRDDVSKNIQQESPSKKVVEETKDKSTTQPEIVKPEKMNDTVVNLKPLNENGTNFLRSAVVVLASDSKRGDTDTLSTEACKSSTSSHAFQDAHEGSDRSDGTSEVSGDDVQEEDTTSQLSVDDVDDEEAAPDARVYLKQFLSDGDPMVWDECEFIEVEEPLEPVELVDSWTQVTEEDLQIGGSTFSLRNIQPVRRFLPPVQEEVEPSADSIEEENEASRKSELKASEVTNDPSVADAPEANQYRQVQLDDDIGQIELPTSTRFEEMIQDPGFMAKTHYFAQRLEELRKLHQFYKNLAKQAPRRNSTLCQPAVNGAVLPDLLIRPLEDELMIEQKDNLEQCVPPMYNREEAFSSLILEPEYNFDWKSLLPEEIEVISESGDCRADADDSASDFSKDFNDTVYDIQSDIMPYLPSNYVSLSSLTAHRPPDLIMTGNLRYTASLLAPESKVEDRKPSPIAEDPLNENPPTNITSLSDDEMNVKHAKVKKDKKKKKLGMMQSSKKASKEVTELETSPSLSKISWSRFFSGARRNSGSKDSPKKSSKSVSKNTTKEVVAFTARGSDKMSKKSREKDCSKESEKLPDKKVRDAEYSKEEQRSPRDSRPSKEGESAKSSKQSSKFEGDKPRSKGSRKNTEYRLVSNNGSTVGIRSTKRDSSRESTRSGSVKQDLSGRGKCSVFQRENLSLHPMNASGSNSSTYHGYDSGADSGVGLKVTCSRSGRRSQVGFQGASDCRQGESSGYESVIRDSECSSFGSSQDSGLDDDGNSSVPVRDKVRDTPVHDTTSGAFNSSRVKPERDEPPPNSTYEAGIDVCESLDLSAVRVNDDPELQEYTEDEVLRYETRRRLENEVNSTEIPGKKLKPVAHDMSLTLRSPEERIQHLKETQARLKKELEAAKTRLMIDKSSAR